jgi:hypothetical protein
MNKFAEFITVLALGVLFSFILSWPVMVLWNAALVPTVSGIKEVDWSTAWCISLLCGMLFKSNTSK